jgi:Na+/H+-dicarboxylate symporter
MHSVLNHRGFHTLALLGLYLLLSPFLPLSVACFLYSISVLIKEILGWIIPFTVCFFIAKSLTSFKKEALVFLGFLLVFEGISNFLSVFFSYGAGIVLSPFFSDVFSFSAKTDLLKPLWHLPFSKPSFFSADKGALLGAIIGIASAFFNLKRVCACIDHGKFLAQRILTGFFSPLAPLFVLGFVVKMHYEKTLSFLLTHYLLLVVCIVALLTCYILLLILLGNKGCMKSASLDLSRLASPGFLAFTSGCSLSTMPWTIAATAKNLKHPELAHSVIPATTNIQQIGDCITNTFLCFLIYKSHFASVPCLSSWLYFTILFVMARYATAAVMGGAIFLMLPIYEKALHFTPEMLATILAFNVILDPIVTSSNVLANGALCKIFENMWLKFRKKGFIPSLEGK